MENIAQKLPNARAYVDRGYHEKMQGNYAEAKVSLTKAIELDAEDAIAHLFLGDAEYGLQNFDVAISRYTQAIKILNSRNEVKLIPVLSEVYKNRGTAKDKLGQYKEAIDDYTKAIELMPQDATAFNNRGLSKNKLAWFEEAVLDFNKAIDINPNEAYFYNNRGLSSFALGHIDEAFADFSKAINVNPNLAIAYLNRGNINTSLGFHLEAIPDFLKAIELNPTDSKAHNNLGTVWFELNHPHKAIEAFTSAINLDSLDTTAYVNQGLAKEKIEQNHEAIADFTTAINLDIKLTDAYIHRGKVYQKLNMRNEAIIDYCAAIPHSLSLLSAEQQYTCISRLLKFRAINDNCINSIKNCQIWFAHPDTFIDKQDGKYLLQLFPKHDSVKQAVSSMLVYSCFGLPLESEDLHEDISINNENTMWVQYGASSKGICLHYQYSPEKALRSMQFSLDKISYVNEINLDENISLYDTLQHGFFTKHTDFHFENECRFITVSRENYIKGQIVNEADLGLRLAAVDFGVECSQEDKQKVFDAVSARDDGKPVLFYELKNAAAGTFKFKRTRLLR